MSVDSERLSRRLDQLEASARVAESAMADVMRQIKAARETLAAGASPRNDQTKEADHG